MIAARYLLSARTALLLRFPPVLLTIGGLCACGQDADGRGWLFASETEGSPITLDTVGAPRLQIKDTISLASQVDLDAVAVAVSLGPELVAVGGQRGCSVLGVDIARKATRWRAGRCGDGPGEFRNISSLAAIGDSLVVVDNELRRITLLDRDGQFLSMRALPDSLIGAGRLVLSVGSAGYGAALKFSLLTPTVRSAKRPPYPLLVTEVPGRTVPRVTHPTAYEDAERTAELGYPACVDPSGEKLYLANLWAPEILVVEGDRVVSLRLPISGVRAIDPSSMGHPGRALAPSAVGVGLACGLDAVGVGYVISDSASPMSLSESHFILLNSGHQVLGHLHGGPRDSTLFGSPIAADRNGMTLRNNYSSVSPALVRLRIVP